MSRTALAAALEAATECLQRGEVDQAFAAFGQLSPLQDRESALAVLSLWRQTPGRHGLHAEVTRIADSFASDAEVVTAACDALIREAERLAPDEPPSANGAAHTVVQLAQHCLERMVAAGSAPMEHHAYLQMCLGNGLRLAHLYERALAAMKSALDKRPEHGPWWYNLGLLHKQRGDFAEGLQAARRARELLGDDKPVLWNVAICATACGNGQVAAEAFSALGLSAYVNNSGMP